MLLVVVVVVVVAVVVVVSLSSSSSLSLLLLLYYYYYYRSTYPKMSTLQITGWSAGFGLAAFFIIVGNILTMVAFFSCKKLLHIRASFFLINLAIADLLVGAVTVPMYIVLLCYHLDNVTYQSIYTAVDIASGFASIFTLTAIGLERLYAFCRPLRHRTVFTDSKYLLIIGVVWILAFIVTILHLLFKFRVINYDVFFYVMMSSLSSCLFFMCVSYTGIWIMVRFYYSSQHRPSASDRKVARMLLIITLTFIVTWLPFHLLNIINFFCNLCFTYTLPHDILFFCKFLHYANSFLNPIIYSSQMPDFRIALGRLLCREPYSAEALPEGPRIDHEEIPLNNMGETEEQNISGF